MRKIPLITLLSFVILSCGTGNNDAPVSINQHIKMVAGCPKTPSNYHDVLITSNAPIPAKLSVVLDGVQNIDECPHPPKPVTPFVIASREQNKLLLHIIHGGAYPNLPKELNLQLFDRTGCNKRAPYMNAERVPLNFKTEYPNGEQCPGISVARVELH